jgi:hypothetical protein
VDYQADRRPERQPTKDGHPVRATGTRSHSPLTLTSLLNGQPALGAAVGGAMAVEWRLPAEGDPEVPARGPHSRGRSDAGLNRALAGLAWPTRKAGTSAASAALRATRSDQRRTGRSPSSCWPGEYSPVGFSGPSSQPAMRRTSALARPFPGRGDATASGGSPAPTSPRGPSPGRAAPSLAW